METLILEEMIDADIEAAGEIIKSGGLVVIPTETVYGLAASAYNDKAVRHIYEVKGRPSDNPLIVHIADMEALPALVSELPEEAQKLAEAFWPGPLTMILKKSELVPNTVSGGLDTVAIRFPENETAQKIINAAGVPLAAPSANISGKPSPTSFKHVFEDMNGKVEAIVKAGNCEVGIESTIISLAGKKPRLLRPGRVTVNQLEAVVGKIEIDSAVLLRMNEREKAHSPGMKYKHYCPKADITIIDSSPEEFIDFANERGCFALCFDEDADKLEIPHISYGPRYDSGAQARKLFSALHELDERNAGQVYARMPKRTGVGLAVYNRLIRAAGFKVLNPAGRLIIGLTGSSGSGKTTVSTEMENLGCISIDCDWISRSPEVYDADCVHELQAAFGDDIAKKGILDRGLLARRAFASQEGRDRLNSITHPRILVKVRKEIERAEKSGYGLIIVDAPTLFEAGFDKMCARIVAVTAPEDIRMKRITQRDRLTADAAKIRMEAQPENEFYESRADYIIDGTLGISEYSKILAPIVEELNRALEGEEA